jgi:SAM-dependent methyltransferase
MTRRRTSSRRAPTLAEQADRHDLYERAVQAPALDIAFFDRTFRLLRRRKPLLLREDFCGTANLAAAWCRSDPARRAIGVDLDPRVLEWGRARHLDPDPGISARVLLIGGDVREPRRPPADVACALNFSYCVFKTRAELRGYFEAAREGLVSDGLFVAELYGGTEAIVEIEDIDPKDGFTYHWHQARYDVISHDTCCHIHFSFPDGSRIERAFTYDWRLWTLPELRELLKEAGFSRVRVYFEEMSEDPGEGDSVGSGVYVELERAENQEAWLAYVVAEK